MASAFKSREFTFLELINIGVDMRLAKSNSLAKYSMAAILVGWTAFAGQTKADSVIYTNGPISFLGDAFSISYTTSVSDSFTVSSPATLTEAEIGLVSTVGTGTIGWSVGTSAFGSDLSSGAGAVSSNEVGSDGPFGIYNSTFSLSGTLSPGTYWLTLKGASPAPQSWDMNNGPSAAEQSFLGSLTNFEVPGTDSEAFTLLGNESSVPEPSSVSATIVLASGLCFYSLRRPSRNVATSR